MLVNKAVSFVFIITILSASFLCWAADEVSVLSKDDIWNIRRYHVALQNLNARALEHRAYRTGKDIVWLTPSSIFYSYQQALSEERNVFESLVRQFKDEKKIFEKKERIDFVIGYYFKFKNPDESVSRIDVSDIIGFNQILNKQEYYSQNPDELLAIVEKARFNRALKKQKDDLKIQRLIWHGSSKLQK